MPISRPVENDDPPRLPQEIRNTRLVPIIAIDNITVDQNNRAALACISIGEFNAINGKK